MLVDMIKSGEAKIVFDARNTYALLQFPERAYEVLEAQSTRG